MNIFSLPRKSSEKTENHEVTAERIRILFKNGISANSAVLLATLILLYIYWNQISLLSLAGWFGLMLLGVSIRLYLIIKYKNNTDDTLDYALLENRYFYSTGIVSIGWSVFFILALVNPAFEYRIYAVLVLTSIIAVAATSLASSLKNMYIYIIPSSLICTVLLLRLGGKDSFTGVAVIVFSMMALRAGRNVYETLTHLISLRIYNENLVKEVEKSNTTIKLVNQSLLQEIATRKKTQLALEHHKTHLEESIAQRTNELLQARDSAERANNAKSEFLSSMSHELRTPLNSIMGFSQLFEYDKNLSPKYKKYSSAILSASRHLLSLVDEILDLAKIEAGKVEFSLQLISTNDLLIECHSMMIPMAKQRDIQFVLNLPDSPSPIRADYSRLKQVLLNLISNAIKYGNQGGKVQIETTLFNTDKIQIRITDNGPGIDTSRMNELFEPFNRLGKENGLSEGVGIGLVITKKLIEMMGGIIGVDSTKGEGSCFWIELPSV